MGDGRGQIVSHHRGKIGFGKEFQAVLPSVGHEIDEQNRIVEVFQKIMP